MKLRARRLDVQRRMRDRGCAFCGGNRRGKRDTKKFPKWLRKPLKLNVLPALDMLARVNPGVRADADAFYARIYRESRAVDAVRRAMGDALTKGMGWLEVGAR